TPEELDNPQSFVAVREAAAAADEDVDAALADLLDGTLARPDDGPDDAGPDDAAPDGPEETGPTTG
ncbi:hypothetical protein PU560_00835, partial [Georgenia sp. 10Sc9-8]|nr:hypothetical protein [Georgenia halotolerans]